MKAFALSGGGGKIGFSAGVVYGLHQKGIVPDYISGISSGALVGIMTATGQIDRMKQLLTEQITDDMVYRKRPVQYGWRMIKHLVGVQSPLSGLYDNGPLKELIHSQIHGRFMLSDYYCGVVDIAKNRFEHVYIPRGSVLTGRHYDRWLACIVASTAIPIIFSPVRYEGKVYVDGGLHHHTPFFPLKRAVDGKADEIIAISMHHPRSEVEIKDDIGLAAATIQTMLGRAAESEINRFQMINEIALRMGGSFDIQGRTYRHYPAKIYRPSEPLNAPLNFDHANIARDFEQGIRQVSK